MKDALVINNMTLLKILKENDVSIVEEFSIMVDVLRKLAYKVILSDENFIEDIYNELHKNKNNEDIKSISMSFEKVFTFLREIEHNEIIDNIKGTISKEDKKFQRALGNNQLFNRGFTVIGYKLDDIEGIRNIYNLDAFKQVLLIFCDKVNNINEFVNKIKIILFDLCFDENIEESINDLNYGFNNRRKEIIYHLYCIDREVPYIIKKYNGGYSKIGDMMSIECSPERNRNIVRNKLTKTINGNSFNCELHTKMKKITNQAPDRIYFCPSIPSGICENTGQIYIYKITKHI
ncbi:DUF3201 domain-containing protein [Anaerovorax odorimutans]|uniref:DUF3201 domain-containing protein n=1 Tax=Anaerovorax odorimutans TaxID=109327 RepID=UPI0004283DA9|nr:DUF3201 domain-containing protein [Anaerovorax odorimutans]